MEKLSVTLIVFLCVIFHDVERIAGEVVEMRVKPGENVTLQCNSTTDLSALDWHRNCSHVNQPPFLIARNWAPARFSVTLNFSTKSSVLRIENITEGDLGVYYCLGKISKTESFKVIFQETPSSPTAPSCPPPDCGLCWILLYSLCPTCSLVTALICSTCVYCLLREKGSKQKELHQGTKSRDVIRKQDEDLCYASLDMPANRQKPRPKKKRQQITDFSTYSDIRTTQHHTK